MNKSPFLKNIVISLFVCISVLNIYCNDRKVIKYRTSNDNSDKEITGEFKGTYKRTSNYKKGIPFIEEGSIEFTFSGINYLCSGSGNSCPLHGQGFYNIEGNELTLWDTTLSSNDINRILLLNGTFEFHIKKDTFVLTQYDEGYDRYHFISLKK